MLIWWDGRHEMDEFMEVCALFIGVGVLATFVRFYHRHRRAVEAVPPFEPAPVVLNINIKLDTSPHADRRAVHDALAALASALRTAIGAAQGPRRLPGPTIN